jgi:hypothetical protein
MATTYSIGHGMRRRNGTPTNHHEAASKMKQRNHATHHEAFDAAAAVGSPRVPMGASSPDMSVYGQVGEINPSQYRGTLIPKKNTQAADPTNPGSKANRQNIERIGATYRITVPYTPTIDPSAGPTMANARIIPSVSGRANPNFEGGIQASSL